ncbi:putative Endoplasmic reticulum mannosyl-oligosaccharide, partial [Cardiosporidium cionae]
MRKMADQCVKVPRIWKTQDDRKCLSVFKWDSSLWYYTLSYIFILVSVCTFAEGTHSSLLPSSDPAVTSHSLDYISILESLNNPSSFSFTALFLIFYPPPCRVFSSSTDIPYFIKSSVKLLNYPLLVVVRPSIFAPSLDHSSLSLPQDIHSDGSQRVSSFNHSIEITQKEVLWSIKHSWTSYKKYAFGSDYLRPVKESAQEWIGLSLTLIDSLGTLWLTGMYTEFYDAVDWIEANFMKLNRCVSDGPFFEVSIRVLGGLVSAYTMSGWPSLLKAAVKVGDRLLFSLNRGFPPQTVNICDKIAFGNAPNLAEATSHLLEFRCLYFLTGDRRYLAAADIIFLEVQFRISLLSVGYRYLPKWSLESGQITLAAYSDSYIEYLLKVYLQTDQTEHHFYAIWRGAMDEAVAQLLRQTSGRKAYMFLDSLIKYIPETAFLPNLDRLIELLVNQFCFEIPEIIVFISMLPLEYYRGLLPMFGLNRLSLSVFLLRLINWLKAKFELEHAICLNKSTSTPFSANLTLRWHYLRLWRGITSVGFLDGLRTNRHLDASQSFRFSLLSCETIYDFALLLHYCFSLCINSDGIPGRHREHGIKWTFQNYFNLLGKDYADKETHSISLNQECKSLPNTNTDMYKNTMDHLACFVPGMLILAANSLDKAVVDSIWDKVAANLSNTCTSMYTENISGLAGDVTYFDTEVNSYDEMTTDSSASSYYLRPETFESLYYMFYFTKNTKYQKKGIELFKAIRKRCVCDAGFSAVTNVDMDCTPKIDDMESFWLSETLKYAYLLFSDPSTLDLSQWLFTTEGHPLPILPGGIPIELRTRIERS